MPVLALAFVSGAAVLALELAAARLIAPFYGTTLHVWSAVLCVTLAALAAGYSLGGRAADRWRGDGLWAWTGLCLWTAGALAAAGASARGPILLATAGLGVTAGAFAAAAAFVGLPLAALGAVGVACVRLRGPSLPDFGRTTGTVGAVSTAGSVAGAVAAGFYAIPAFGPRAAVAGLAAVLAAAGAAALARAGSRGLAAAAGLAGLVLAAGGLRERPGDSVRARVQSLYGEIKVVDREGARMLLIDGVPNTVCDLRRLESQSDYIHSFELLPHLRPKGRRAALIGLGGGSLVKNFERYYKISTDVVDIDPTVVAIAREWFDFRPSGEVRLEDGRVFLEREGPRYDFLVLDAFASDQQPYHLFSREAFAAAARRLEPDGILAINVIGYAVGPRSRMWRSVARTLREEFPHLRVFVASTNLDPLTHYVNITMLASREALTFRKDPARGRPELARLYERVNGLWLDAGPRALAEAVVITDDLNPMEELGALAFRDFRLFMVKSLPRLLLE